MVKYSNRSLDAIFAALSSTPRRQILERLVRGERRVTDLAEPFSMSLPAVSKHLRILETAGLLKRQHHGREHRLQLEAAPLKEALRWVEQYRRFWEGTLDALADYLEKTNHEKKEKKS